MLSMLMRMTPVAAAAGPGIARAAASDGGMNSGQQHRPPFARYRTRRTTTVNADERQASRIDLYL